MTKAEEAIREAMRLSEQSISACRSALDAIGAETPPEPDDDAQIDLAAFRWAGKKTADPTGLPAGARYGEGEKSGKRTCQWKWPAFILHAVFPTSVKSATAATAAWYHFTTNGQPSPLLSAYKWKHTHTASEGGVTWYRYAGG